MKVVNVKGARLMCMRLPDVDNPRKTAELAVYAALTLNDDHENFALDLGIISATGCAFIRQLGAGIFVSIWACLTGPGGGRYDDSSFSFDAAIGATVTFGLNVPILGTLIEFTIVGEIGCTAAPKNVVSAYGKIGIAGAGIELDLIGNTAENALNK
ncbi:hypothetical protein FOZ60_005888 [Perkinsus olseni]|uniref:Uncharacterized protein n=1 Tax=Perkinsus olseni TaxID=32597 RepID=A0A7J6NQ10_PEROL|nr:hypothetical protein FOZ60_005888 [Perkinsus olseni]